MDWIKAYQGGLSIPQIAATESVPRSRVRTTLLTANITLRSRADGIRLRRDYLGELKRGQKRKPFSEQHKSNISAHRQRWAEANAKGVVLKPSGYIEYTRGPNKGRSVHDVTMEKRLGRRLLSDEVVHHIDGDRGNNDDNNLALMTKSGHMRLHRREQRLMKGEKDGRRLS